MNFWICQWPPKKRQHFRLWNIKENEHLTWCVLLILKHAGLSLPERQMTPAVLYMWLSCLLWNAELVPKHFPACILPATQYTWCHHLIILGQVPCHQACMFQCWQRSSWVICELFKYELAEKLQTETKIVFNSSSCLLWRNIRSV